MECKEVLGVSSSHPHRGSTVEVPCGLCENVRYFPLLCDPEELGDGICGGVSTDARSTSETAQGL